MVLNRINLATQLQKSTSYPGLLTTNNANQAYWLASPTAGAVDAIVFYDHSGLAHNYLTLGTGLTITGTVLSASASGNSGYSEIQEESTSLTARTKLAFIGSGLTAADDATNARTTVTLDPTLNSLSQFNSNGFLVQTAQDTFAARTLTGTTNRLTITNTTGGGNPVFNVDPSFGSDDLADAANIALLNATQTFTGTNTFSKNITMQDAPSNGQHLVTVDYVNDKISNTLWKTTAARGASTEALTITARTSTTLTVGGVSFIKDGITYANTETFLLKDNSTGAGGGAWDNGIFTVSGVGTNIVLTRRSDADTWVENTSAAIAVSEGDVNADSGWLCTANVGGTLGTTALNWIKLFSSVGTLDGSGQSERITVWSNLYTLGSDTNGQFKYKDNQVVIGSTAYGTNKTVLKTKGTNNTNTEYGIVHVNSSDTEMFRVDNAGTLFLDNSKVTMSSAEYLIANSGQYTIKNTSNHLNITTLADKSVILTGGTVNSTEPAVLANVTRNNLTNNQINVKTAGNFNPTGAGTSTYTDVDIAPTINQTTHSGITYSTRIHPTLTSVPGNNHVALSITAAGQMALHTTAGNVRLDIASAADYDMTYRAPTTGILTRIANGTTGQVLKATSNAAPAFGALQSTDISDFTEATQDIVGAFLTDTNTINFTYNDVDNSIATDVRTQLSISSDNSGLKLLNDVNAPGSNKIYGTNGLGTKGWFDSPSGADGNGIYSGSGTIGASVNNSTTIATLPSGNSSFIVAYSNGSNALSLSQLAGNSGEIYMASKNGTNLIQVTDVSIDLFYSNGALYLNDGIITTESILYLNNTVHTAPDPNAILDVDSTDKVFFPPRMTQSQRDLIAAVNNGALIFNTDTQSMEQRSGNQWKSLSPANPDGNGIYTGSGNIGNNVNASTTNATIPAGNSIFNILWNGGNVALQFAQGTDFLTLKSKNNSKSSIVLADATNSFTWGTSNFIIDTDGANLNTSLFITTVGGNRDPKALIEINSITKALMLPRMTTTEFNAFSALNGAVTNDGIILYESTVDKIKLRANGAWVELATGNNAIITASNGLTKVTNDIQLGGTLTGSPIITGDNAKFLTITGVRTAYNTPSLLVENTSTGSAVQGNSTSSGVGVYGSSQSGTAVYATADSGLLFGGYTKGTTAAKLENATVLGNSIVTSLNLYHSTTGTPADGLGSKILFSGQSSAFDNMALNTIVSKWTTVDHATRLSNLSFTGYSGATENTIISMSGTGAIKFDKYGGLGFTGTPAKSLFVDSAGNVIQGAVSTGTVTASGPPAANQVAYWTTATDITGSANFTWDNANARLGVGVTPITKIHSNGTIRADGGNFISRGIGNAFATTDTASSIKLINTTAVTGDSWHLGSRDDGRLRIGDTDNGYAEFHGVNNGGVGFGGIGMLSLFKGFALGGVNTLANLGNLQQNNLNIGSDAVAIRLTSTNNLTITGFKDNIGNANGGWAGRFIIVINIGGFNLTLSKENLASTPQNRFSMEADFILAPSKSVIMWYDETSTRWRVLYA